MHQPTHVLNGYKVLDFTQVVAGPTTTRLMAEMGAEVIKIELSPGGDLTRALPYLKDGRSAYFIQQNYGKKSVCLDLRHEKGVALVKQLAAKVDVVIESFTPGVMKKFGLHWDAIQAINPQVVMASLSAFGQDGPLHDMIGYDYIAQAYAGVMSMIGEEHGPPMWPMLAIGDAMTGYLTLAGITSALLNRTKTGVGRHLDISLLDAYMSCHEMNIQGYSASGGEIFPKRSGAHHYQVTPAGVFKGSSSYLYVIALPHQWHLLCKAIGREDLIDDPDFVDLPSRLRNRDRLIGIIETWLQSFGDDEQARLALVKGRVPVAPILTVPEMMAHPHHTSRRVVRTVNDRQLGEFVIPGMPLRFSGYPHDLPRDAPFLGEHNLEVLSAYLGMSAQEVVALEKEGVLKSQPVVNNRD